MEADVIVLDTTEHGESDLIVTFFGKQTGRLSAIAKGAKRSKKRFVNKLEVFSFLHISCQQKNGRNLAFLSEAELYSSFVNLRQHINLYTTASIIREFLILGVKDQQPDLQLFRLSIWAFNRLDQRQPEKTVLVLFLIRYFSIIGYCPDLQVCGGCEKKVNTGLRYSFFSSSGQLFCSLCGQREKITPGPGLPLSHGTIKLLQMAQNIPLERLHRMRLSGVILKESMTLFHCFARQIFQKDIISWKALNYL
jgi:DNA repair protein RecO (recombination protein O)